MTTSSMARLKQQTQITTSRLVTIKTMKIRKTSPISYSIHNNFVIQNCDSMIVFPVPFTAGQQQYYKKPQQQYLQNLEGKKKEGRKEEVKMFFVGID